MKKIIAATDFSPAAENALNYAADMANSIGAHLLLIHVTQLPVSFGDVPLAVYIEDLINAAEKDLAASADKINTRMNGRLGIEKQVKSGTFYEELSALCEVENPYAVVIGSQGKTKTERVLWGSHAVYAMKHLNWPTITVPPFAKYHSIRKIGLASDFAEVVNYTPVEEIKTLVKDFSAKLYVLNTAAQDSFDSEVVFQSGMLQEMIGSLNPSYHFIANENVEDGILQFARENNIDLLIVLPKHHKLIERITQTSHTKQLVIHSHVPVMALHESERRI